jgi:hypothetical protein
MYRVKRPSVAVHLDAWDRWSTTDGFGNISGSPEGLPRGSSGYPESSHESVQMSDLEISAEERDEPGNPELRLLAGAARPAGESLFLSGLSWGSRPSADGS